MDSDEYGYLEREEKYSSKKKKEEKRSKRRSPRSRSRSERDKREAGDRSYRRRKRSPRSISRSERDEWEAEDRARRRRKRSPRSISRSERDESISRSERDKWEAEDRSRRRRKRSPRSISSSERDESISRSEQDKQEARDRSRRRRKIPRSRSRSERDEICHFSRRRSTSRADDRERERDRPRRSRSRFGRDFDTRESRRLRDQRTVFAYQMPLTATRRDVCEFFCTKACEVREVCLITDSTQSKGVGIIEFKDAVSVSTAVALSGQHLLGQPVMVIPYGDVDRTLYVGNLHFLMTERQLREIFEPYGTVGLVQLPFDLKTKRRKGFGFVEFATIEQANAALSVNEKLEIGRRIVKVSSLEDGCNIGAIYHGKGENLCTMGKFFFNHRIT